MRARGRHAMLAERIARDHRALFLKPGKPGGRLPPVRQLAGELGVCVKTVRAVQSLLAEQGLLDIRHGSGVYVVRQPGVLPVGIYTHFDVLQPGTSTFHLQVPHDLRLWFQARGQEAEIYIGQALPDEQPPIRSGSRFETDVRASQLAGLVLLTVPSTESWRAWIERLPLPVVGAGTPYTVETDNEGMVREGVRLLAADGCRRIALLAGHNMGGLRDTFARALADVGLPRHPEWMHGNVNPMFPGAGWEEFRALWTASRTKPDAILVTDDVLFQDASRAILELGIAVPDKLRIVSHANAGIMRHYPFDMTLLQVDPMDYAERLGDMLMRLLNGETPAGPCPPIGFLPRRVKAGSRCGRRADPAVALQAIQP